MHFSTTGLSPALLQALAADGLDAPTPIQKAAIPELLEGKSTMLVSRTGSGKTLAYLLPILDRLDPLNPDAQALVLAPTHELAMQISRVATAMIAHAGISLRVQALIGGAATSRQIEGLKKKPHLLIGSAGRVAHLMELGKLKIRDLRWLVLDEADRLLIEKSLIDIQKIATKTPAHTQYVFVSATETSGTTTLARALVPKLEVLRVQDQISPSIRHAYLVCEDRDKIDIARRTLRGLTPRRALIFVHRGANAERMAARLEHHGLPVADLHGAKDKFARQTALNAFRRGTAPVLIASDIAARGLDVEDVDLVINVDVPSQGRDYLHRAGRTGRNGRAGLVLSLMTEAESRLARRYAEELSITMEKVRLAQGTLVAATDQADPERGPRRKRPPQTGRPSPARNTSVRAKSSPPSRSKTQNTERLSGGKK